MAPALDVMLLPCSAMQVDSEGGAGPFASLLDGSPGSSSAFGTTAFLVLTS